MARKRPATSPAPPSAATTATEAEDASLANANKINKTTTAVLPTKTTTPATIRKGEKDGKRARMALGEVEKDGDKNSDDVDVDVSVEEDRRHGEIESSGSTSSSESDDDDDEEEEGHGDDSNIKTSPTAATIKTSVAPPQPTFMDAFYGLASDDVGERAAAAREVVGHCSRLDEGAGGVGGGGGADDDEGAKSSVNVKDASYALTRLLKGLGSGRASARQGNASALAAFLKVAAATTSGGAGSESLMEQIVRYERQQQQKNSSDDAGGPREGEDISSSSSSCAAYIFQRLRDVTAVAAAGPSPSAKNHKAKRGKNSSSSSLSATDERDAKLGLLFGILALIRSEIVVRDKDSSATTIDLVREMGRDLMKLYKDRRCTYLQGPAAHAVSALLCCCRNHPVAFKALAEEVMAPELAPRINNGGKGASATAFEEGELECSADDAAMILVAQSIYLEHSVAFPPASSPASVLGRSLLTKDRLAGLAPQLGAAVGRQRSGSTTSHLPLIFEAVVRYMTVVQDATKKDEDEDEDEDAQGCEERALRTSRPFLADAVDPWDLLNSLWRHSTTASSAASASAGRKPKKNAPHDEPLHLAFLMLFRVVAGLGYASAVTGHRTRVSVKADALEQCLSSPSGMVAALLHGLTSPSASPELRAFALETVGDVEEMYSQAGGESRLVMAKALVQHDPGFDSKTKTRVVARLVRVEDQFDFDTNPAFLDGLLEFVVRQIALTKVADDMDDSEGTSNFSSSITPTQAVGYLDLLLKLAKVLLSDAKSLPMEIVQRFTGALLPIAFFDCSSVAAASARKEDTPKKTPKHPSDVARRFATAFKESRAGTESALPTQVRETAAARFYSIVSLVVARSLRATSTVPPDGGTVSDRGGAATDLLSSISSDVSSLLEAGATLMSVGAGSADGDDADPVSIRSWLRKHADKASGTEEQKRCFSGFHLLGATLYLSLLQPRDDEVATGPSLVEVATELLTELKQCFKRFAKPKPKDDCPLSLLSSFLIDALSSPLMTASASNGAYPTLLRDVVRHAWISALGLCDLDPALYCKDSDAVVNGLLDAVGATDADDDPADEDSDDEDDDEDDDSDASDASGNAEELVRNGEIRTKHDKEGAVESDDDDDDDEAEEEEVLEAGALQTFLEEDASVEDMDLEHHEGADAALATFIRAKQDARKAGQAARERAELENQLRSSTLLEALLISKDPTRRGLVVSGDRCIRIIVSLAALRKRLEKSVLDSTSSSGGTSALRTEKRNLMERVTVLLRTRLFRSKLLAVNWDESTDVQDFTTQCCTRLLNEIKGICSKEQRTCFHLALMAVLRGVPNVSTKLECAASIYEEAVMEWTTKRTTRIDASLCDELIEHDPVLAQIVLAGPLSHAAATSARTPFLKLECLRLTSKLYKVAKVSSGGAQEDELKLRAAQVLAEAAPVVVEAYCACLGGGGEVGGDANAEMLKSKRLRELLKSLDAFVQSSSASASTSTSLSLKSSELRTLLKERQQVSDSPVVKSLCDRILGKLPP